MALQGSGGRGRPEAMAGRPKDLGCEDWKADLGRRVRLVPSDAGLAGGNQSLGLAVGAGRILLHRKSYRKSKQG